MTYDPIHVDTLRPNNVHRHTIYRSPNSMLQLISVTPFWAVALKLVRYTRNDPGDVCLILRYSFFMRVCLSTYRIQEWDKHFWYAMDKGIGRKMAHG